MITYGFAKEYIYNSAGTLLIKVRIPSIHGPYTEKECKGTKHKPYVQDKDLPWYPSILLPHLPTEGEVVAVASMNSSANSFIVIGLTGGSYNSGVTDIGG